MEETLLKFTTKDVTIELQGSEEFVERQIKFFKHYLDETPDGASNGAAAEAPAAERPAHGGPTLEQFFRARATRAGRGANQEALLLFGYYLPQAEGLAAFSIEQLGACFALVGRPQPKNLHHAVGTLKRKQKWFQPGSKRGLYCVSERGRKLVRPIGSDA